jgi:cell shape-determining protein MreC
MYKVERKPDDINSAYYEVMLSPFKSLAEVAEYIEKYKQYYPVADRVYKITELSVP